VTTGAALSMRTTRDHSIRCRPAPRRGPRTWRCSARTAIGSCMRRSRG
jgi:hypothetical protein